ncbi:MAG: AraC family transcriptional regulator [Candidatus Limiplasma sp.]|nr:AraC family transcriptional regulator [Candidatus Limiplasma sp.]
MRNKSAFFKRFAFLRSWLRVCLLALVPILCALLCGQGNMEAAGAPSPMPLSYSMQLVQNRPQLPCMKLPAVLFLSCAGIPLLSLPRWRLTSFLQSIFIKKNPFKYSRTEKLQFLRDRLLRRMLLSSDFLPAQSSLRRAGLCPKSSMLYRVLLLQDVACCPYMDEESAAALCSAVYRAPYAFFLQHPIVLEDGSVAIVLAYEKSDQSVLHKAQSILEGMPQNWQYTAILSAAAEDIVGLNHVYRQAGKYGIYALFDTSQRPFVAVDEKLHQVDDSKAYPLSLEWQIYDSICNANFEKAEQDFTNLLHLLRSFSPDKLQDSASHLLFTINAALAAYGKKAGCDAATEYHPGRLCLSGNSIPQMQKELHGILNELSNVQCKNHSNRTQAFVKNVDHILQVHFCDNRMSLNLLADKLDLTPNYVGRTYKRAAGISIPDKIMAMRMEKARELLKTTRMSISQIANHTGFTGEGYFYKAFKQHNGCTPTDYRKTCRQLQIGTPMVSKTEG